MILPIIRTPKYISPSSFITWENCNYFTYLDKNSPHILKEQLSTPAAAIGTVFDIVVKSYLCTKYNWSLDHEKIWDGLVLGKEDHHIIEDAVYLAKLYIKLGIINDIRWKTVDFSASGTHNGVPIFGYPDAETEHGAFDWKTTGYSSAYTVSPKQGYTRCWNLSTGRIYKEKHHRHGEPFHTIDRSWAIQMLFYKWLVGATSGGQIHQLIYQKNHILLAELDIVLDPQFEWEIEQKLQMMWEQVNGAEVELEPPVPSEQTCLKYNQLCKGAEHCGFFTKWWTENHSSEQV